MAAALRISVSIWYYYNLTNASVLAGVAAAMGAVVLFTMMTLMVVRIATANVTEIRRRMLAIDIQKNARRLPRSED